MEEKMSALDLKRKRDREAKARWRATHREQYLAERQKYDAAYREAHREERRIAAAERYEQMKAEAHQFKG